VIVRRPGTRASRSGWLATLASVALAAACNDERLPPPSVDGGLVEPSDVANEVADPNPPCRACIAAPNEPGPGCADELSRCGLNRCFEIFECGYAAGCQFKKSTSEAVECYRPCLGRFAEYDPALVAISNLLSCADAKCIDVCAVDSTH